MIPNDPRSGRTAGAVGTPGTRSTDGPTRFGRRRVARGGPDSLMGTRTNALDTCSLIRRAQGGACPPARESEGGGPGRRVCLHILIVMNVGPRSTFDPGRFMLASRQAVC